ncbi:MAG: autotransporter outer membrane beta-barrel domain-containing protein, partial [Sphingobium sp.]
IVSFGGDGAFGSVTIDRGRLIGLAGSRIAASRITVAPTATFGSAGTVTGDIAVAGTLSPGASPGTMTVIGNVSLAAGSTSLFELTPTVSDQLRLSGTLTITPGATLTLTGTRPLTPGVTLDLIMAEGGINGTYSTINKPSTIAGFLSQSATRLQILGTFATNPAFAPQINASIDYLNTILIAGQASTELLAAVPNLLTAGGSANSAAFQTLSPEAYASASQLGTEQALTIVDAARSLVMTQPRRTGLFTFGQALTDHRRLGGNAVQGTSLARSETYGGLSGVGIAHQTGWVGAFVGYLDGRQTIAGLGARTETDGVIAGVQGQLRFGPVQFDALAAYSDGTAQTRRTALSAPVIGRYDLHSWVGNLRASFTLPMRGNWLVRPTVGLTGISTVRGATQEDGAGPFALSVAREQTMRWMVDGDVSLLGGQSDTARLHPSLSFGIRHQFDGRASAATASFHDVALTYRVPGVTREATQVTGRVGFRYDLNARLDLFAVYGAEVGNEARHNASVGLRMAL